MKKIVSLILAVAMLSCLCVHAFAADKSGSATVLDSRPATPTFPGNDTCAVDVKIAGTEDVTSVYYVTVEWEALNFTYTFDATNEWDPLTHTYGASDATNPWDKTSAKITTANHSNEKVNVAVAIDTATKNGVTVTLTDATKTLATGVGLTFDTADKLETTVAVSGVPTVEADFTIGTVTVTFTAA